MITDKEEDDAKVLRHMSVESYEAGFKKLWKLFSAFDLMVTKITELQVVQFLLYDDMYSAISEDSQRTGNLLLAVSKGGFSSGLFQITQVILDRNKDLFAYCNDAKRKYSTTEMSKNQDNSRAETNELIKTLRK